MMLAWTLVVWTWSLGFCYAQQVGPAGPATEGESSTAIATDSASTSASASTITSTSAITSTSTSEWPSGATSIDRENTEFDALLPCQRGCIQNYNNFTAAEDNCEQLDASLVFVYNCILYASSCKDISNVQPVQKVVVDYCVKLQSLASTAGTDFTIQQPIPVTLPVTIASSTNSVSLQTTLASLASTTTSPSATGPSASVATGVEASAASINTGSSSNKGLSQEEQIGIGVGVGVGVPVLVGLLAALFCLARRRKNKGSDRDNPYGAVYANDKAAMEDGSEHAGPQETHPMNSSATPFLPVPVVNDVQAHHEHDHEQAAMMQNDRSIPAAFMDEPPASQYQAPASLVIPSGRPKSTTAVSPQVRHSYRTTTPIDDDPPSPVSPVSPVSEMGSRPASLVSNNRHHDL